VRLGSLSVAIPIRYKKVHRYLLHNGDIRDARDAVLSPGQVGFMNGWGVFSTLRVSDGVLFAYPRHYARMRRDAALVRVPFNVAAESLHKSLVSLLDANHASNATLRVALVRNKGGLFEAPQIADDADLIAFTADLTNWGNGVHLNYVPHGRHGASPFAGLKVTSWAQNLTWYDKAHEDGYDEVLLLNEHGQISECTSANIFVLRGAEVLTPPLADSGCLPGVTRAILLEEIRLPGFTIREEALTPAALEEADGAFITSTTRDLLPVLSVDRKPLKQSPETLHRLLEAFRGYRSAYVLEHSRKKEMFAI
jgi:branched-chain amino acid aminotransferase